MRVNSRLSDVKDSQERYNKSLNHEEQWSETVDSPLYDIDTISFN